MRLSTTSKINIDEIFLSEQIVHFKKNQKVNGKLVYSNASHPLNTLPVKFNHQAKLLISYILQRQNFTKGNRYVNIPTSVLVEILQTNKRDYQIIIGILNQIGVIKVNSKYFLNSFSKSYCIGDTYVGDIVEYEIEGIPIDHGRITIDNGYIILQKVVERVSLIENPVNGYNNKEKGCRKGKPCSEQRLSTSISPHCSTTAYNYQYNNLLKNIRFEGDIPLLPPIKLNVSPNCNRVFTTITSLKKEERQRLIDKEGNRLITIDFSTSHLQHLIKLIDNRIDHSMSQQELKRFKISVLDGDFYNNLVVAYQQTYKKLITRKKSQLYTCCWLSSSYSNWKGVKLLKSLYPDISNYVDTINGPTKNKLLNDLMKSESHLINDIIINELAMRFPDSMSFTIFDGILIENQYLNTLCEIINSTSFFGFKPKYRIELNNMEPVLAPCAMSPGQEACTLIPVLNTLKSKTKNKVKMKMNIKNNPEKYTNRYATYAGAVVGSVDISSDNDPSVQTILNKVNQNPLPEVKSLKPDIVRSMKTSTGIVIDVYLYEVEKLRPSSTDDKPLTLVP